MSRLLALPKLMPAAYLQDALKAQHFLWQLLHIERDMKEAVEEAKEQKEQLNESARALYAQEQQIEAKKKIVAGFQKERLLLERKLKKRKAEADKKARPKCPMHDSAHPVKTHMRLWLAGFPKYQ